MSSGEIDWYPDQDAALDTDGDLVLTASAGTGKTTILVEKFTRKLFELIEEAGSGNPENLGKSTLGRIVAITFTELAAAELKNKIAKKLAERYSERREDRLLPLMRQLDGAYIGTIHSFCRRLLRENFIEAGLSPAFSILDEDEAAELRIEAASETLSGLLENDSYVTDLALHQGFGKLREEIILIMKLLRSDGLRDIEPERQIEGYRERWRKEAVPTVARLREIVEGMKDEISAIHDSGTKITNAAGQKLNDIGKAASDLKPLFNQPERLLDETFNSTLSEMNGIRLIPNKGFEALKDLQVQYRRLYDDDDRNPGKKKKGRKEKFRLDLLVGIEADAPRLRSLFKVARLYFEAYDEKKRRRDSLDFDDLLLLARDLLKDNKEIRKRYCNKFKYIYVDEFQDVNPLQRQIVDLLYESGVGRSLVIVGDGKQSIYRFRGADVLSFEGFADKIVEKGGKRLDLRTNFRSHPALIRSFNAIFGPLFTRERESNRFQTEPSDMEAHHKGNPSELRIEWIKMAEPDDRREGMLIAGSIMRMVNSSRTKRNTKPIGFGDITVLLAAQSKLPEYEEELRRHSIPYIVVGGKGFYRQREIWDVASYLKLLWFPEDDYALAAVLRSPLCLLSDETLYRLAEARTLNGTALFESDLPIDMPEDENERFAIMRELVSRHRAALDRCNSAEIIEDLLEETGYEAVLLARPGGDQAAANLRKLIETARAYESRGVATGLEFALDLASRLFEKDDEPQALLGGADEDCVRLMTVHKAKGLQFPVAVIPQLRYAGNRPKNPILYDSRIGLGAKAIDTDSGQPQKSPSWILASDSIQRQQDAEHLRLLYVAMTRASEYVVLIGGEEPQSKLYVDPWESRLAGLLPDAEAAAAAGVRLLKDDEIGEPASKRRSLAERYPGIPRLEDIAVDSADLEAAKRIVEAALNPTLHPPGSFAYGVRELVELIHPTDGGYQIADTVREVSAEDDEDPLSQVVAPKPVDVGLAVHRYLEQVDYGNAHSGAEIAGALERFDLASGAEGAAEHVAAWLAADEAKRISLAETEREVPFTVKLSDGGNDLYLSGAIDLLVELPNGGHWLIDYKHARRGDTEAYELQLRLYALALQKALGRPPRRTSIVYLLGPEIVDVEAGETNLKDLEKEIIAEAVQEWRNRMGIEICSPA